MLKKLAMVGAAMAGMLGVAAGARADGVRTTIIYDDVATELTGARVDGAELWVTKADLKRATRFEVKPQGVCRDELCFPLPRNRQAEFEREEGGAQWFHLTEFARLVAQPVVHESLPGKLQEPGGKGDPGAPEGQSVWYFGLRGDQRQGLSSLKAPNFTLPDLSGKMHSLADFRGKKVLLVTWASW